MLKINCANIIDSTYFSAFSYYKKDKFLRVSLLKNGTSYFSHKALTDFKFGTCLRWTLQIMNYMVPSTSLHSDHVQCRSVNYVVLSPSIIIILIIVVFDIYFYLIVVFHLFKIYLALPCVKSNSELHRRIPWDTFFFLLFERTMKSIWICIFSQVLQSHCCCSMVNKNKLNVKYLFGYNSSVTKMISGFLVLNEGKVLPSILLHIKHSGLSTQKRYKCTQNMM